MPGSKQVKSEGLDRDAGQNGSEPEVLKPLFPVSAVPMTTPPSPSVAPSETPPERSQKWRKRLSFVMDQPSGFLGEIQPQDVSPSDVPPGMDLPVKPEDGSTALEALDALQLVRSSSWYPHTSDPGLQFSDGSSSDIAIQSRAPNNTLSHTTVTVSYMSRSHVFSSNGVSQHSPLYNIPPVSKLSLHSHCGSESHLRITDYSQEQIRETKYPPTQEERLLPQGRAGQACRAGGCEAQGYLELNGDGFVADVEKQCPPLENKPEGPSSPATLTSVTTEKGENGGAEVPLFSEKQSCMVASENTDAQNVCRDYKSPLEEPVSPSSPSLDAVEHVFVLPQASSSPSADDSHLDMAGGGAYDALSSGISDTTTGLDLRENEQPEFTVSECGLDVSENHQNHMVPHINGKDNVLEKRQRKLPVRAGRTQQLEKVVMNRNSSPANISGCSLSNQTNSACQSTLFNSTLSSPKAKRVPPLSKTESKSAVKRRASQMKTCRSGDVSTSDSELNKTEASSCSVAWDLPVLPPRTSTIQCRRKAPPQSGLQTAANRSSIRTPQSGVPAEVTMLSPSLPQSESPKKQDKSKSRRVPPASKKEVSRTPKRRRRKTKPSHPSSMFSPKEPEIKLKYVSYKEEKRDSKLDFFSPFIRVERKQSLPSLCSVINYPEEVRAQQKTSPFVSAVVPNTSCLHLGRPSIHSQHQRAFICCLCGQPANAMDLGDLHGPYYPEGLRPSSKTSTSTSGLKEEEEGFSDSDSSSFGMTASRRKSMVPHTAWSVRNQLKQNMEHRRRAGTGTNTPAAKQARLVASFSDSQDWFSPPILPLEPCEYWLHEDCSIWSAGVFLVKGRVYGLEEAVRVAHETMCSGCQHTGATLGCVFKGCPNKYHYRCALESGCVLIEDNFSMKCKKHKNKTLKAPLWSQWNGR
ncbi:hypothetical protein OJAV_G00193400 [Oryzias javanicus]|uniref:PHD-type domain-containing protein n=1 Tax=Oryzias javanicus TaxID=123683 RepID=A0A437CAV1_ORYJA|nr:hypothetical protein OJAV_G00193400 [Oryzias javanicus]